VIVGVGDDDPVRVANRNVVGMLQLSGLASHSTEFPHECAIALEDLDAVIFLIAHVDESKGVSADTPGIVEFTIRVPLTAESSEEVSRRIEDLNSMIVSVGDDVLADPIDSYAGEAIKLSFAVAVATQPKAGLSVFIEDLNPVVGRIRHHDGVIGSHSNTSRPSKESGLAPPSAELQYQGLFLEILTSWQTT